MTKSKTERKLERIFYYLVEGSTHLFMTHVYSITEFTIIGFVARALTGQRPYVLRINPIVPRIVPALRKLVEALVRRRKALDIRELIPEHTPEFDYEQRVHFYDVFAAIESWQAEYFEFERTRHLLPDYARALRHASSLYLSQNLVSILVIPSILKSLSPSGRIIGVFSDIADAAATFAKTKNDLRLRKSRIPNWVINVIIAFLATAIAAFWALCRIRIFKKSPKVIFFAADYVGDKADDILYEEIVDGGEILVVARCAADAQRLKKAGNAYTVCSRNDGVLGLIESMQVIARIIKENIQFLSLHGDKTPGLFYRIISLPLRRAEYQAMFNRYRPRVFWGRDSYDPRHILRRAEMHLHGGESWSVCHSYLTYGTSYPEFRHIAYDRYYVLGKGFYEYYCREVWNPDIKVIETGTFRVSRETFRLRLKEKPKDILVLCSSFIMEPGLVELVRSLAENFPDRTVYLQVKETFVNTVAGKTFIEACLKGLENVILATADVYYLFGMARYAFSDPSTAVIEAIQFGVYTLATDISPTRKPSILLEIPEFSVTSGKQAVKRIQDIESGRWRYPIEEVGKFIDLTGQVFCDRIRRDLGLPELEKPQSAWPDSEKKQIHNPAR